MIAVALVMTASLAALIPRALRTVRESPLALLKPL